MTPLDTPYSTEHASSSTAYVVEQLQLYGYHPGSDEPDPRPLPEPEALQSAISSAYEIFADVLQDSRLEPDLSDLLWMLTDIFHRKAAKVQRQLDDNETNQRSAQDNQDGSEVRSVELEKLILQGQTILERRNAFEACRDMAAEHYEAITGSAWRPRAGSMANRKTMTAAMVDSRDFIAANKYAEVNTMIPPGKRIAVAGGVDFNDHKLIWAKLDMLHSKYPDMVLLHGGAEKGTDKIVACWADKHRVPQIRFVPEWKRDGQKRAGFLRNDRIIAAMPAGLVVFPGSGLTNNLADKAKAAGIAINDYRGAK